jgi:hypothetical protein
MTSFTKRIMIAAAGVVIAAASASAQTLKAEIPFAFRAGGAVMQPGVYRVDVQQGATGPSFRISNLASHQTALLLPGASDEPHKAWVASGKPVLSFECTTSRCALAGIWPSYASRSYAIPHAKMSRDEVASIETVVMRPSKGE